MKRQLQILIAMLLTATIISSQTFEIVSTKLLQYNGENNIEFDPSINKHANFTQNGGLLQNDETISLVHTSGMSKYYGSWRLEATETNGNLITSNSYMVNSLNNAGTNKMSFALLFEIRNISGASATLYYAINPNISKINVPESVVGYYQLELYKTNSTATSFTEIYYHRYENNVINSRIRGTAIANVPAGETVYIYYAVSSNIAGANGYERIISASTSLGFSDSSIPTANDLGFGNFSANDKMLFQIFNLEGWGNSFIPMGNTGAYAFQYLDWTNGYSQGFGLAENIDLIDGTDGIALEIHSMDLFSFEQWSGDEGDSRTYINGTGYVKQNGTTVLTVKNVRFDLEVSYPAPYGSGNQLEASGWGEIDYDNSDADWANALDPYNTGEIYFECASADNPLGDWFDVIVKIVPSPIERIIDAMQIPDNGAVNFDPNLGLSMNIAVNGKGSSGSKSATNRVMAVAIEGNPGGTLPEGIGQIFTEKYWEVGTTAENFNATLTFDLNGFTINNYNSLRVLKRENENDDWIVWSDITVNEGENKIMANNVTNFSEFAIASTESAAPVELVAFTATASGNEVKLNWATATEINNYGYEVERQKSKGESNWETIGFVEGAGNSNSPKSYSFTDKVTKSGMYSYRLKQIDLDGAFEYSSVVEVNVGAPEKFELMQNYPNPFNPTTTIKYSIPSIGDVETQNLASLRIYNILGEEVATLVNKKQLPGNYSVKFNAKNLPSGVYFYVLKYGNLSATKKMLLLK